MNPPSPEPEEAVPRSKWNEQAARAVFDKYRDEDSDPADGAVRWPRFLFVWLCSRVLRQDQL